MTKKQYRCSDGFCGADDCTHCHPEWRGYEYDEAEDDDQDAVSVVGWEGSTTAKEQDDD